LITGATKAEKKVATFALDGEITFATPADRAAFAEDLTVAVTQLAGRYNAADGRRHRIVVAVHPSADPVADPEFLSA
jgi:hypothetical protein